MSLYSVLGVAISGLRTNSSGLGIVSQNIAGASDPNYIKRRMEPVEALGGSVRSSEVTRVLDKTLQSQIRIESAAAGYAETKQEMLKRIEALFGVAGEQNTLEIKMSNFTERLRALVSEPGNALAQNAVIHAGESLANGLNKMEKEVQLLRQETHNRIGDVVSSVNSALKSLEKVLRNLGESQSLSSSGRASLLDERDRHIQTIASMLDVKVVEKKYDQVTIYTNSGSPLVDNHVFLLESSPGQPYQGSATHKPALELVDQTGKQRIDVTDNVIRSGRLAALLEIRDEALLKTQARIDAIAESVTLALSDETIKGNSLSGTQQGFDLDLSRLAHGNTFTLTLSDSASGEKRYATFVKMNDAKSLPLTASFLRQGESLIGVDFSGGLSGALPAIQSALGTDVTLSNVSGDVLRVVRNAGAVTEILDASAIATASDFSSGYAAPFFVDGRKGNSVYTGHYADPSTGNRGLSGGLKVNSELIKDRSLLLKYNAGVQEGDPERPFFMLEQLTEKKLYVQDPSFDTDVGYETTISNYVNHIRGFQSSEVTEAENLHEGQKIIYQNLVKRFNSFSSVSIDEEMGQLIMIQTAYAANSRVLIAAKEMMQLLSQL